MTSPVSTDAVPDGTNALDVVEDGVVNVELGEELGVFELVGLNVKEVEDENENEDEDNDEDG